MSQDLLTQLAEYGAYCDENQGAVDANDVLGSVVPIPTSVRSSKPARGWLVAAAAAALMLVLIGGVALLNPLGGAAPVVDEPIATTIPTVVVNTTMPPEAEISEVTETTLAFIPVPPPGEGPKLEFTQAEPPNDPGIRDGVWFQGVMYASPRDEMGTKMYRSVNGLDWEAVPDFSPIDKWGRTTKTNGELLVNVAGADSQGNCLGADASIQVNTSTDGAAWTSSEIQLPLPATSSTTGCFNSYGANFAVGPRGIVVTTSVDLEIGGGFMRGLVDPDEGVHIEVAEIDLERGVITIRLIEEETGEVVDTVEIDGLGKSIEELLDAMAADAAWEPLIEPLLQNMAENGPGVRRGFAWFSVDGRDWQALGDVGPLQGANTPSIASIVATADGFVATSEATGWPLPSGSVQEILWHSVDGTSWTEGADLVESHLTILWPPDQRFLNPRGLDVWAGLPVAATDEGVWIIEESPLQLIPAEAVVDMTTGFWIGELGLVGLMFDHEGAIAEEVLFSSDGSTWNRWDPPEFGPEDGRLFVVGMGDDFFVVQQGYCNPASETPSCSLWVGRLP